MVREKRRLFEMYITDRNERNREEHRQKTLEVKILTRQKTNGGDERDGIQLSEKFRENKRKYFGVM